MKEIAHGEKHSDYGDIIRDVIIGFADGLTVPFALTAGLSSYVYSSLFVAILTPLVLAHRSW